MVGIYRIYNLITGQSYIGQSIDLDRRIREHFYRRAPLNIDSKSTYTNGRRSYSRSWS